MTSKMNNCIKKIMVCGSALLMVSSLMASTNSLNASAKRIHHNRVHRIYRRRNRRRKKIHRGFKVGIRYDANEGRNRKHNRRRNRRTNHKRRPKYRKHQRKINRKSKHKVRIAYVNYNNASVYKLASIGSSISSYYRTHWQASNKVSKQETNINNAISHNLNHYKASQVRYLMHSKYMNSNLMPSSLKNRIYVYYGVCTSGGSWNTRGNNNYASQVAYYEYQFINQFREQHGLKPLAHNNNSQRIANMRAEQADDAYTNESASYKQEQLKGNNANSDKLVHGLNAHESPFDDASHLGIKENETNAENAGAIEKGVSHSDADAEGDASVVTNDDNPRDFAYNQVNLMMNYDRYCNNGHRNTILDKNATGVGVSAYYHSNGISHNDGFVPIYGAVVQDFNNNNTYKY